MSDKFKISDLKSEKLIGYANIADTLGKKDGSISKSEFKDLQKLLNGDAAAKAELAGESDNIKKLFGYTETVKSSTTEAASVPEAEDKKEEEPKTDSYKSKSQAIKDAYYKYRGIDPITRQSLTDSEGQPVKGLSPEAAYQAVLNDNKDDKEAKKAIKNLRKYSIDTEARFVVLDAIDRATAKKSKDVKKEAEAILKAEGNWDKHTKKALNGKNHSWWSNTFNWLSGKQSDMKLIRKAQAAGNVAADRAKETYTEKQFTDAIGKRSPLFKKDENGNMAIQKLTNVQGEQLVTQKDGKYDISKLSEFISTQIGSDNTLSRQHMDADAELEAIRSEFRKQGIELTKRDTKQLVEFCGYRVEHKNYVKALHGALLGGVAAAAGTAAALKSQPKDVFKGEAPVSNHLELNLTMEDDALASFLQSADIKKLQESGVAQITNIVGGVQILVDQNYVQPFFAVASRHIAANVLKSAGVGAAIGLLAGLLDNGPSEEDIFSTRFECRSYEDFLEYVDSRKELTDAQKLALKQVAMKYIVEDEKGNAVEIKTQVPVRDENGALVLDKDGKPSMKEATTLAWDCEGFKDYLNREAGYKSNLNRIELFKAVKKVEVKKPEPEKVPEEQETDNNQEVCEDCETKQDPGKEFKVQPKEVKFRSWQDLVNGYDCLNNKEYNKVINGVSLKNRMVKVIQAIDVSNVKNEEELKKVYNIKTIAAFAEDAIRYGFDKAAEKHPELTVNKQEYIGVVTAKAGLSGNAYVPTLYYENGETCEWTKKTDAHIERGKGKGTTATITKKGHTVNGQPTYWRKCPGGDWEPIDKATYDALQK